MRFAPLPTTDPEPTASARTAPETAAVAPTAAAPTASAPITQAPTASAPTASAPITPAPTASARSLSAPIAFATSVLALASFLVALPGDLLGQWTNRYPRVQGFGHHVYLEGYELPTLSTGVMDPAPGPDGRIAFTSRGWIWVLDPVAERATRLTSGTEMDFRPSWSPAGDRIAFVRDSGLDTWVVIIDAETGEELHSFDSPALDLDPVFTPDGSHLIYSSAREGTLDLWRVDPSTGEEERLTSERGIQLRPQALPEGDLLYLSKAGGRDAIRLRSGATDEVRALVATSTASQSRPAVGPDGRTVAVNWPVAEGWELRLFDTATPDLPVFLTEADGQPLAPAWSADGQWIYFSQPTPEGAMELRRIAASGGEDEPVPVHSWDWGEATGTVRIRTVLGGAGRPPAPARLNVVDGSGHPALPERGQPRFDGQNGKVFFYSPGVVDVTVPAGRVEVSGVQGLATPEATASVEVRPGEVVELELPLEPLWDARAEGWLSGEHHFHLNYGGPFQLEPNALHPQMAGEAMEVATPLVANLHNRFGEREFWGWESLGHPPLVTFGQEVRSHFLGHVALVGIRDLFWPWVWGPGYQVYGRDDRPNAEALRWGRGQGGIGTYVHPVTRREPFVEGNEGSIPVSFVPDAVLGDLDALEVVCLWSDELGTADLWYRVLNLGIPVAAVSGSDVMTDFYRTMAIGTTRNFVHTGGREDWHTYLDGLREGRGFVTTGPYLDFRVTADETLPGDVVPSGQVEWTLDLRSPVPVDRVEILVNGEVVHTEDGLGAAGSREYDGTLQLPEGGWVAARAHGGEATWPIMDSYPFAHSGPVWIGERGSVEPAAASLAAVDLLRALDAAEARLRAGYEGTEIPRLQGRFDEARERLEEWIR